MADIDINFFKPSRGKRIRKAIANIFLGLLVIGVGVGYLGNHLDFCPWNHFTLFFPGWGALFLMVPALYFFIRRPTSVFWPIVFLIGVLILLANQKGYGFGKASAIVLAVSIIFVGLRILLIPLFRSIKRKKKARQFKSKSRQTFSAMQENGSEAGTYSVRFGDRTVDMSGQTFTSATLDNAFGQLKLDLRGALVEDSSVIDARCAFGEIEILLPDYVKVEVNPTASFGDVSNHHTNAAEPDAPTLYINADCSFGEIVIK